MQALMSIRHAIVALVGLLCCGLLSAQCDQGSWQWSIGDGEALTAHSVLEHANGDVYVAGYGDATGDDDDFVLARFTQTGGLVWAKRYGLIGDDGGVSVFLESGPSGSIYIGGTTSGIASGQEDGAILKLDQDGTVLWSRQLMQLPFYCQVRAVAERSDGRIIAVGSVNSIGAGNADAFAACLSSDGALEWLNSYGWPGQDHFTHVELLFDGSFLAGCQSMGASGGTRKGLIAHINEDGLPLGCRLHDGGNYENYSHAVRNPDGSYLWVGFTQSYGAGARDVLAVLTNDAGDIVWSKSYGTPNQEEGLCAIVDPGGGWLIAAFQGSAREAHVLRVQVDGTLEQVSIVQGLFVSPLGVWAKAMDAASDGGLYFVGQSSPSDEMALWKLDGCGESDCVDVQPANWSTSVFAMPQFVPSLPITASSASIVEVEAEAADMTATAFASDSLTECEVCAFSIFQDDLSICVGSPLLISPQLEGAAAEVLDWTWDIGEGPQLNDVASLSHSWEEVGIISAFVAVGDTAGVCSDTAAFLVEVLPPPAPELGPDVALCDTSGIELVSTFPSTSSVWNDVQEGSVFLVSDTGVYWLTVEAFGCSGSDTIVVFSAPDVALDLGGDTATCPGVSVELTVDGTWDSLVWSNGSISDSIIVSVPGTYWAQGTMQGCVHRDTIVVDVILVSPMDLGPDTALCAGGSVLLGPVNSAGMITWSDGSSGDSLFVSEPGLYSVVVDTEGCQVADTIEVFAMEAPVVDLGGDTVSCGASAITLVPDTAMGGSLQWSTGSAAPTIQVGTSGIYWLSIQNLCGIASDTLEVLLVETPNVDLGADTTVCGVIQMDLSVPDAGGSVLWSTGSSSLDLTVTSPGQYWVVLEVAGCESSDTLFISRMDFPSIEPFNDTLLCVFSEQVLEPIVHHADLLTWSDGSTGNSLVVREPGTYQVLASNECGTALEEVSLEIVPQPLVPRDHLICPGGSTLVSLPADAINVLWSTGGVGLSEHLTEGAYSYSFTDGYGCEWVGQVSVVVDTTSDGLVFLPNVFTPNNDGVNEVFRVVGADKEDFELMVFNRWGEEIFHSSDPRNAWDGTYCGGNVPDGTYVYVLKYRAECGVTGPIERIGHVSVLR